MSSEASAYQYEALRPASQADGEFRLLTLLPGARGSQIQCRLEHATFRLQPRYEALSYTWGSPKLANHLKGCVSPLMGDPTSTHSITLNGHAATVPYNLESALQQLRSNSTERVLWIDALCINQFDLSEKSEQVKAMAKVYHGAFRVLAWLGEHDEFVDLAFDTLEQICWATKVNMLRYCAQKRALPMCEISDDIMTSVIKSEVKSVHEHNPFQRMWGIHDKMIRAISMIPDASTESGDVKELAATKWGVNNSFATAIITNDFKIGDLPDAKERVASLREVYVQRTYWNRLWIVQELLWASEVIIMCGQRQVNMVMMSLPIFLMSVVICKSHPLNAFFRSIDHEYLVEIDTVLTNPIRFCLSAGSGSLSSMIQEYAENLCFEPRDRIYALLSLSIPSIGVEPDYSKPVAEVYMETTYAIINRDQTLNILCAAVVMSISRVSKCLPYINLPSWVPHFESVLDSYDLNQSGGHRNQHYCAGGPLPVGWDEQQSFDSNRILKLDGYFYGRIRTASARIQIVEALASRINDAELLQTCIHLAEQVGEQSPPTFETWQALFMDLYQAPNHARKNRISTSEEVRQAFGADLDLARDFSTPSPAKFLRILYSCLDSKAICKTTKGNIALVLGDVDPGDLVYVAKGATNPFILRPTKGGRSLERQKRRHGISTFYQFVGGAYVHGIMDGEALSTAEEDIAVKKSLLQKTLAMIDGSVVRETSVFLI